MSQVLQIQGQVLDHNNVGVANANVIAVDAGTDAAPLMILSAATDKEGYFALSLSVEQALRLFRERSDEAPPRTLSLASGVAQLALTVYQDDSEIGRLDVPLSLDDLVKGHRVVIRTLDREQRRTAPHKQVDYVVYGRVSDVTGAPGLGLLVNVVRRRLRDEETLTTVNVGADGAYRARYTAPDESRGFALYVQVVRNDNRLEEEVGRSEVVCPVPPVLELNLQGDKAAPLTEFVQVDRDLAPEIRGLPFDQIDDDGLEYLACVTDHDLERVTHFVLAQQLAVETTINASVFYGLGRRGYPLTIGALGTLRPERVRAEVELAIEASIIPPLNQLDAIIRNWLDLVGARSVSDTENAPLGQLLATVGVEPQVRQRFLAKYLARTGSTADFWNEFVAAEGDETADAVRFSLQMSALTGHHLSLVTRLSEQRNRREIRSARDLARLNRSDWQAMITGAAGQPAVGVPVGFPGENEEEQTSFYATTLARAFEELYPTEALIQRVATTGQWTRAAAYSAAHPECDLRQVRVAEFVDAHPPADGSDTAELVQELKIAQRLFVLAPHFDRDQAAVALLNGGIHSAQQIANMGRSAFVAGYGQTLGGEESAAWVYDNAEQVAATVMTLFMRHSAPFNPFQPAALGKKTVPGGEDGLPDLEGLFGPLDYCDCEHCRSVLSPAAYLVDLLRFVENRPILGDDDNEGSQQAFAALIERRPDLVQILLDCANTNTVLPTIDLVNEILERAVANVTPSSWPQTTRTAEELRAHPEHLLPQAYDVLREAVYPWVLPFDLALEESRGYLSHLGAPLWRVLEVLGAPSEGLEHEIARERLGLSALSGQIVAGEATGHDPGDFWGTDAADVVGDVTDVRTFLARSGLTFTTFQELERTAYAGGNVLGIEFEEPCQLDGAEITGLNSDRLSRIHRFMRLQQASQRSIFELDAALQAIGESGGGAGDPLGPNFLRAFGRLQALLSRFSRLSKLELLAWCGDLETRRAKSDERAFYETIFVETLRDGDPSPFAIGRPPKPLADHLPELSAALELPENDVQALIDLDPTEITSTLATLSRLFRWASLARALQLSIAELLQLVELSGTSPFTTTGPQAVTQILAFIEVADCVAESGLSLARLDHVLRHQDDSALADANTLADMLVELIRGLQTVRDEISSELDPSRPAIDVLADRLVQVLSQEEADALLAVVQAPPGGAAPAMPGAYEPFLSVPTWEELHLELPPDASPDTHARATLVLAAFLPFLRRTLMRGVVVQKLADTAGLTPALTAFLLAPVEAAPTQRLALFVGGAAPLVDALDFASDAEAISAPDFASHLENGTGGFPPLAEQMSAIRWLHKVAVLMEAFDLSEEDVRWLYQHADTTGLLNPEDLPIESHDGPSPLFDAFARLQRFVALSDRLADRASLRRILIANDGDVQTEIAAAAFWPEAALGTLITHFELDDGALRSVTGLERLNEAFALAQHLGVSADRAASWAQTAVSFTVARDIKAAAKAKYPVDRWPAVAEPLRDALREKQRDALVAHVLAHDPEAETPEELFGRFLIDVMVSSCAKTSRIKQALSSLQTFVQRVLLNLEPGINFSEDAATEWRWLQRYRVWEANRKIFLWPENWLEPELRDDKTELFEAFEAKLLEHELSEDSAEAAFLNYAEELDQIAQLHVAGVYHQIESAKSGLSAVDLLHVFARTRTRPFRYFYRQLVDQSYWTPWCEVPLEIKADGVIPTTFNRRLMLFWPMIEEHADQLTKAPSVEGGNPPPKHHQIRMAWSELRRGEWSPARISDTVIDDRGFGPRAYNKRSFFFHTWPPTPGSQLVITPSHTYDIFGTDMHLQTQQFRMSGCNADLVRIGRPKDKIVPAEGNDKKGWIPKPSETVIEQQWFAPDPAVPAVLWPMIGLRTPVWSQLENGYKYTDRIIASPYYFTVVAPRQMAFSSKGPFFYQDLHRSFCIFPSYQQGGGDFEAAMAQGAAHQAPSLEGLAQISHRSLLPEGAFASSKLAAGSPVSQAGGHGLASWEKWTFRLEPFSHPFTCRFITLLRRFEVEGLLQPPEGGDGEGLLRQVIAVKRDEYNPGDNVVSGAVVDTIDFDFDGAYSVYNWELFFHAPMYVALRFMEDRKFAEAQKWMHYVFNPTEGGTGSTPARFWRLKPFFHHEVTPVDEQLEALQYSGDDSSKIKLRNKTLAEIAHWRENPFRPHALARLRTAAYQRWVVMRYLDNLLQWADDLFAQDTIETNNEALQLYILAAQILGPRPLQLPSQEAASVTYTQIQADIDAFSNFVAEAENVVRTNNFGIFKAKKAIFNKKLDGRGPLGAAFDFKAEDDDSPDGISAWTLETAPVKTWAAQPLPKIIEGYVVNWGDGGSDGEDETPQLYFCVPPNRDLLRYWDVVADRLFKLRHCLNIEGVFRQLPLFQPPIDPGLLARATAAGVDLSTALSDLGAPLPHYRFSTMIGLAKELAAEVRTFGGALADALRSKDAEALAELRAHEEVKLLEITRRVREQRIGEAEAAIDVLDHSQKLAWHRAEYYRGLDFKSNKEQSQLDQMKTANQLTIAAGAIDLIAGVMALIPKFKVGINGMGPETTVATGGQAFYHSLQAGSQAIRVASSVLQTRASMAGIEAGYERRRDEWAFQEEQANKEIDRISTEKAAAELRIAIAQRELKDHDAQIASSKMGDEYLHERYTNAELYRWMSSEVSRTYFQAYQLAYDIAKQAQRCYQYELGAPDSTFIEFGYWDNRRKGLLAGDRLLHDLRRMETAYLANNRREYELSKRISLASLDPMALLMLRQTGHCEIDVPEALFDLDHPGHYMRRIKMVSLTIPAVTGPYVNVAARLTWTHSAVRTSAENFEDPLVVDTVGTSQSIATSSGQGDAGLFEFSFRDERYLPFEGKGAISHWRLELPAELRQFDYQTIEDVLLEIRYTAREGGQTLAAQVLGENGQDLESRLESLGLASGFGPGMMRVWRAATHFPEALERFTHAADGEAPVLSLNIGSEHFPLPLRAGHLAEGLAGASPPAGRRRRL